MRNLGGAIGIALIDTVLYGRAPVLGDRLVEQMKAGNADAASFVGIQLDDFSALAEGNARRVENAYRDTLSAQERKSATDEENSFGSASVLLTLTIGFLQLEIAPLLTPSTTTSSTALAPPSPVSAVRRSRSPTAIRKPPRTRPPAVRCRSCATAPTSSPMPTTSRRRRPPL